MEKRDINLINFCLRIWDDYIDQQNAIKYLTEENTIHTLHYYKNIGFHDPKREEHLIECGEK